ncbi:hypothetical protein [Novosphingobium decolorationis]|uniref:Uncharacterized protein n=1 Tax=Novosphingobium decolorationis TaxID=2698673 RepID=A0ABX8E9B8_9SPHN|nr:hypothetical protein [Novosphingobium decolorationis]QVM85704.1 hypothetical protein HT578_20145 [Novosphingobium decolorationis]
MHQRIEMYPFQVLNFNLRFSNHLRAMFWRQGLGHILGLASWSGFGASLTLGAALPWLYGEPCSSASTSYAQAKLKMCTSQELASVFDAIMLAGSAFLILALLCRLARSAERRREEAVRLREIRGRENHTERLRVHTNRRWPDDT